MSLLAHMFTERRPAPSAHCVAGLPNLTGAAGHHPAIPGSERIALTRSLTEHRVEVSGFEPPTSTLRTSCPGRRDTCADLVPPVGRGVRSAHSCHSGATTRRQSQAALTRVGCRREAHRPISALVRCATRRPARTAVSRHKYHRRVQLAEFAAEYPPTDPLDRPGDPPDAFRLLTDIDGVGLLPTCVATMRATARPGLPEGCHLWVILPDEVPVIIETAEDVQPPPLTLGRAKHTNLTGGGPACCGGELWRDAVDADQLYVHGGSGRYGARSPQQLEDAVRVIEAFGFKVRSAGWSEENDCPARVFR
jgi:hypothetical protein